MAQHRAGDGGLTKFYPAPVSGGTATGTLFKT